jgi:hypothetical protein
MKNTKSLAIVAVLIAAALVAGTYATVARIQSAFARYTITEDMQAGWRAFLFGDCNSSTNSGTISAGEHQTCTIRNILENGGE